MIKQAVVLAGGLGSRLGTLTKRLPKPMMTVSNRPFLLLLLQYLRYQGIKEVVLAVSYLAETIRQAFGDGQTIGLRLVYAVEDIPGGTGGFLFTARHLLHERFLVINGDTFFTINYEILALRHYASGVLATLSLVQSSDTGRFGLVRCEGDRVIEYGVTGNDEPGLVSGGSYIFSRNISALCTKLPFSIENDLIPMLVTNKEIGACVFNEYFIDIGVPNDLRAADKSLPAHFANPLVLVIDDVISDDLHDQQSSRPTLKRNAVLAIKLLNEKNIPVALISSLFFKSRSRTKASTKTLDTIKYNLFDTGALIDRYIDLNDLVSGSSPIETLRKYLAELVNIRKSIRGECIKVGPEVILLTASQNNMGSLSHMTSESLCVDDNTIVNSVKELFDA